MSLLKGSSYARTGEMMRRKTLTVDADTVVALAWLRSRACRKPIAASRLLRDAAAQALAAEGMAIVLGKVVTLEERADYLEKMFRQTLEG